MEDRKVFGTVLSAVGIPFGVLALFSMGGQLAYGPFALAIEWILARLSPESLRIVWSVLAGLLAGEMTYLIFDLHIVDGFPGVVAGIAAALVVAVITERTTRIAGRARTRPL